MGRDRHDRPENRIPPTRLGGLGGCLDWWRLVTWPEYEGGTDYRKQLDEAVPVSYEGRPLGVL